MHNDVLRITFMYIITNFVNLCTPMNKVGVLQMPKNSFLGDRRSSATFYLCAILGISSTILCLLAVAVDAH